MAIDADFEALLRYVKESRGFDFTGYKRTSLMRRFGRQMANVGVESYEDYLDYLQVHPEEFIALFDTILINVTGFFRDVEAWNYVSAEVIPELVRRRPTSEPIRIWSAGCASGQEAYSLAMAFSEALGIDEVRDRVKIYATDVDDDALVLARHAAYTDRDMRGVPPELIEKYFEPNATKFSFRKDLRRVVIFGRNDLVQDAPISRIDLLSCRNTLMYFNAETQARILARLHFALNERGVLFLGKAEMLLSHSGLFAPIELKRRFFRKVTIDQPRNRNALVGNGATGDAWNGGSDVEPIREAALLSNPLAEVLIDAGGRIALTNQRADALFGTSSRDRGRPFQDVELSYRPVELRTYLAKAKNDRRSVVINDIEWHRPGGDHVYFDVQINPLLDPEGSMLGFSLTFQNTTRNRQLQEELQHANRQLETAYEELQSTNEELETTNEELQSTVEELETTNEELQSTNEELETMNEELQSMNDELQSTNEELSERTDEVDNVNHFMESILTSLRAGVIVVDDDMRLLVWNRRAEDLWGLRSEEAVNSHLLNLDIGLPVDRLKPLVRSVLTDGGGEAKSAETVLDAVNRKGRTISVRVTASRLGRASDDGMSGVILVIDQIDGHEVPVRS